MKITYLFAFSIVFAANIFSNNSFVYVDFDYLLGKNTITWKHIQTKDDGDQLAFYKNLYEKNKLEQFSDAQNYKIPKIVHFIWIGPKNFPRESIKNIRTWISNHPDWEFIFWTDRDRPAPCNGMNVKFINDLKFNKLQQIYESATNWSQKADIITYEILYNYGGIYSDHDANSLKSFDKLNKAYDFYSCLELPQERIGKFTLAIGHGLMGAKKHHPVIKKTMDILMLRWEDVKSKYPEDTEDHKIKRIMEGSYIALTYAIQTELQKDNNVDIVFPASYFFANMGLTPIYSKHFFASTWIESKNNNDYHNYIRNELGFIIKKINRLSALQYLLMGIMLFMLSSILVSIIKKRKTT